MTESDNIIVHCTLIRCFFVSMKYENKNILSSSSKVLELWQFNVQSFHCLRNVFAQRPAWSELQTLHFALTVDQLQWLKLLFTIDISLGLTWLLPWRLFGKACVLCPSETLKC